MEIMLQPIPAANEVLRSDLVEGRRLDVSLPNGAAPLVLGKNATTGIADSSLKRKMVKVQALDRFVRMDVLVELTKISVNGRVVAGACTQLRTNDVISLHGDSCSYSYKVIIKKQPQPPTAHHGGGSPAVVTTPTRSSPASKKRRGPPATSTVVDMTDEFSCPVCLDLFVEPTLLVPCGHSVCLSCLDQISTECMTCRTPFHDTAPNWTVDHALAKLVADDQQHFFDADDCATYRSRRQQQTNGGAE